MSKCYPQVLYPSLILKYLVRRPAKNLNIRQSVGKLSKQNDTSLNSKSVYIQVLFFLLGFIVPLSFKLLSPFWLVAVVWLSIGLGMICVMLPSYRNSVTNNISPSQASNVNKAAFRLQRNEVKLSQLLAGKVLQPTGKSDATTGVSEQSFYQVICRIFPNVTQGIAFHNLEFSYPYSADFVLVHTSGLSIDVEIDEPYVGNTKAPHHCTDQRKDGIRNAFFTNNNWVVVRFSEKQAVKYPLSCCKVIASVLAQVADDHTYLTQLQNVPLLPTDPMWTIKQAKKLARADYRKTYLPNYRK